MAYITVADLREYLDTTASDTFTASAAADTLTLSSVEFRGTMKVTLAVTVSTTNTLPAPLAVSTIYYVILGTDQAIQLATTSANATAGTQIDLTTAGVGTHTITKAISDTDLLTDCISDAQAFIDAETNRAFEAATTTKYYAEDCLMDDNLTLFITDDLLTITTLTNGDASDTVIPNTEYTLVPRNEQPPYHGIRLNSASSYYWQWDEDKWVSVAGTYAYSTTATNDIRRATLRLAAFYYRQRDSQLFQTTAIPEAGVITMPVGVPNDVMIIISKYKRYIH